MLNHFAGQDHLPAFSHSGWSNLGGKFTEAGKSHIAWSNFRGQTNKPDELRSPRTRARGRTRRLAGRKASGIARHVGDAIIGYSVASRIMFEGHA
jgi:hypothetical protein